MKKRNRTWYIVGAILILIVLLISLKKCGVIGKSTGIEVEASKVTRQTIIETVNASGKVQPEKEVKISADISGEITHLSVKEGDRVKKGDLLVRIKPDQYQRGVERAQAGVNNAYAMLANAKAGLAQAKANLERSKLTYERNKKLYDQKVISEADFENFKTEYEVVKAQYEAALEQVKAAQYGVASANATLKEARDALAKTAVYSPMDGYISVLNIELGERVVGTMQMAGTEMMRVADLAEMEVEVDVNENDIIRLSNNDTAEIEIDAFRGRKFRGIVTEISSSAESNLLSLEKVTNFKVKVRILKSSYADMESPSGFPTPFRPGMSANVSIQTTRATNVIAVPVLAVTVRNLEGKRDSVSNQEEEVVFIIKDDKVSMRPVKTGIQDNTYFEITDGLKEGEVVISGPYSVVSKILKDGDKVSIKEDKSDKKKS